MTEGNKQAQIPNGQPQDQLQGQPQALPSRGPLLISLRSATSTGTDCRLPAVMRKQKARRAGGKALGSGY
jgi:hypothetical protein